MQDAIIHTLTDSREAAHRQARFSTWRATLDGQRAAYATAYMDALVTCGPVPTPSHFSLTHREATPVAVAVANIILAS